MKSITALEVEKGMTVIYRNQYRDTVIDVMRDSADSTVVLFFDNGSCQTLGASEHVILVDTACAKCGALLKPYYLKDGVCNGCRNPHLIVTAQTKES